MSKVRIKKNDKYRILLTELLPYEVPMLFSNEGFYSIIINGSYNELFLDRIKELTSKNDVGIPFNYEIKKTSNSSRKLSLIHPKNQYNFIDFYENYQSLILHLCSKSPFSLRAPVQVAKLFYSADYVFDEDGHRNPAVETEPEILDRETKLLKSYFVYKKYDLLFKFHKSYEYQQLEQRFFYKMEFDISKCFYNIYTHSITWAVKDKATAKREHKKDSFENDFDKLMQRSNYNETNGIVVGPEISRIFAEIILQQVDMNVMNALPSNLSYGVDYEVKRYIDNYYVFTNRKDVQDEIYNLFVKELDLYKLYINDSKTSKIKSPFITDVTVGKNEINKYLKEYFSTIFVPEILGEDDKKQEMLIDIKNPSGKSRKFIVNFQCIAKRNDLTYDSLSKEVIQYIKRLLIKMLKKNKSDINVSNFQKFLWLILDISFYAYSTNITVSATYKISQIIVLLCKYAKNMNEGFKHSIYSKISKESKFVIDIYLQREKSNETNIEIMNLIIALKMLENELYFLSENKLRKIFSMQNGVNNINYFQILTILYYIGNSSSYSELKKDIEQEVARRFLDDDEAFLKADSTCLFFDYICCPFVSDKSKREVMRNSKFVITGSSNVEISVKIEEIMDQKKWFMDWSEDVDLEMILKKKEFGSSY